MSATRLKLHLKGALYGLAAGDALGAPYEFKGRGSYAVSGVMEPSYTFTQPDGQPMEAGTWTDDTSTALCLAESLNEKHRLIWEDVAEKFVRWHENDKRQGYMSAVGYCFGIGNATSHALTIYSEGLSKGAKLSLAGSSQQAMSGNVSLMRLAPIPVFYYMLGFFECAKNNTGATNVENASREGISAEELNFVMEEVRALRAGAWKMKTVGEIKTSGFVWALWNSRSFEEGMLMLLPLGSDVDTVCAIYRQLAGALYGIEAIPDRWLNVLQGRDILENVFDRLVENALRFLTD